MAFRKNLKKVKKNFAKSNIYNISKTYKTYNYKTSSTTLSVLPPQKIKSVSINDSRNLKKKKRFLEKLEKLEKQPINKQQIKSVAVRDILPWFKRNKIKQEIRKDKERTEKEREYFWWATPAKFAKIEEQQRWKLSYRYSMEYLRVLLKGNQNNLPKKKNLDRNGWKKKISEYIDEFHQKEDIQRHEVHLQKKTFRTRLPELFFQPWKRIAVSPTEKQHWLNIMYTRHQNLRFKDRIDFFKTYIGQIIGSTYWQKLLPADNTWYVWDLPRDRISVPQHYVNFKTWHKKGWWYENLIQKTDISPNAKKFVLDRPQTAFQAYWAQRKLEPWKDALMFRRALYSGFSEDYRKENKFETLKMKEYLRRKNPRQEKRNRLYKRVNFLLNNFRQRDRVRADKMARIKQITGKILRPFYGHLRENQIKYIVKKSKKIKSEILSYNEIVLNHLENRLDVVVYRINLAPSILWARRLIKAGFIFVTPETNRFLWESMYCSLKKFSFPLKLRDPKNLYAKTYWTWDQEDWVEWKFLGQPNKKISYLLQKGDLIQCAAGTYLNHFKTQTWVCRKPLPGHLLTSPQKNYAWDWRTQKYKQHIFKNWEQNSEYIFSTIFLNNPQYRDLDSKHRFQESFLRWAIL